MFGAMAGHSPVVDVLVKVGTVAALAAFSPVMPLGLGRPEQIPTTLLGSTVEHLRSVLGTCHSGDRNGNGDLKPSVEVKPSIHNLPTVLLEFRKDACWHCSLQ